MDAFDNRVAGVEQVFVGVVAAQYGAIIADSNHNGIPGGTDNAPKFADQAELTEVTDCGMLFAQAFHEWARTYRTIATLAALNNACMVMGASNEPLNSYASPSPSARAKSGPRDGR
jgi:deoxycytidylate deaminase